MTISLPMTSLLVILALVAGAIGGYAFQLRHLKDTQAQLNAAIADNAALASRTDAANEARQRAESQLEGSTAMVQRLAPLQDQVEKMRQSLIKLEDQQAHNAGALNQQLDLLGRAQQDLTLQTRTLHTALTSPSARGVWGEVQLHRVVEAAGMLEHVDFNEQDSTSTAGTASDSRPDMTILLPGNARLAIDAKAPLAASLKIQPGMERAERAALLAQQAKDLRAHIKTLKSRDYPSKFPGSPQFTVLFLPTESILTNALEADGSIVEDGWTSSVVIATPSSLLALLKTVSAIWGSTHVTEQARKVFELGQTLVSRLATFDRHLAKVGESLTRAVSAYNQSVASIESRVLPAARKVDAAGNSLPELNAIDSEKGSVRTILS
ncbi:MAG: DNA recombination protein RmuC [Actinomycetaceae bacterium]|nr:DNA recombination protein RmuC [Actinomycetaceae bacterium]MDY6083566.1 DNA recombination protein RmuC [Actinomycetaceae bacterium]